MSFETILFDVHNNVAVITLNRPDALNALNSTLMQEVCDALASVEANDDVNVSIITGSEKAFAAGADIKQMADQTYADMVQIDLFGPVQRAFMNDFRKPVIAAVAGYALGGGCELAMMCDFIIAAENAKFGQPEINLGVIPGIGGTQRLTKLVGKSKAMDMMLTGRMMCAVEAERAGLASRIVPTEDLLDKALEIASVIASKSRPSVAMAKNCVNVALETGIKDGITYEARVFEGLFATEDQKEGMAAFSEKRQPNFKHK